MKRNDNRIWYNKGYSDGVQATKKDAKVPKAIGVVCLTALLMADQYWILAFVILWLMFDLQEWYGLKKYHEPSDPPKVWDHE